MEFSMTMKSKLLAGTILGAFAFSIAPAHADAQADMQKQIDALNQQIQDLQVTLGNKVNKVEKAQAEAPQWTFNNARPVVTSADGRFSLALRGRFHLDAGAYFQDSEGFGTADQRGVIGGTSNTAKDLSSGTNFRRAELGVEGVAFRDWYYSLNYTFGGSGVEDVGRVKEAYIQYRGIKLPAGMLKITVGAYQEPLTMEDSTSSNEILFMERASINNIVTDQLGGEGRSALGFQANGDNWFVSNYLVGSTVAAAAAVDEQTGYAGRGAVNMTFLEDAARVHAGVSGGVVMQSNQLVSGTIKSGTATTVGNTITLQDRPELRLDSTRLVGTGALNADGFYAYGAELAASYKNAYIQGEYYIVGVDRIKFGATADTNSNADGTNEFSGYYVQTSWIVTGENKPYKTETATYGAPKVTAPFDLNAGTWGALELKARYSFLNLNDNAQRGTDGALAAANGLAVRGGEQQVMGAGFNWYPNNNIRFMVDWMNVTIDKQASNSDNAQIGQNYNALGIRTQFAF